MQGNPVNDLEKYPLINPVDGADERHWFPASEAARRLLACIQGCLDVEALCTGVNRHASNARMLGLLTIPVVSLAENVLGLRRHLGREDRSKWPEAKRDELRDSARALERLLQGRLRQYRNRRAAHHDPDFVADVRHTPTQPSLELIAEPLGLAIVVLGLLFNHDGVFVWNRYPDPSAPDLVEQTTVTGPMSIRFKVIDGEVRELLSIALATDPRHEAFETLVRAATAYNRLIEGSDYRQIIFRKHTT